MGRDKKNKPRRQRRAAAVASFRERAMRSPVVFETDGMPTLVASPARILESEQDLDEDTRDLLITWPFQMINDNGHRGQLSSLMDLAEEAKKDLRTTIEGLLALEDANLLAWDKMENGYRMLHSPEYTSANLP